MFANANNSYTREWLMGALGYTEDTVKYRTVNDLQYEYYRKFSTEEPGEYLTTAGTDSSAAAVPIVSSGSAFGLTYHSYGTSYTAGSAASPASNAYTTRVAQALGATHIQGGVSGSSASGLPYGYMQQAAFPVGQVGGLVSIEAGINDIGMADAAFLPGLYNFTEFVMTAMRWCRAKEKRSFEHASVNKGPFTFSAQTGGAVAAGSYISTAAGATLTIIPGGATEIVVLLYAWRAGSADTAQGADYEVQVDSGPWQARTTKGRGAPTDTSPNVYTFVSERITGLSPTSVVRIRKVGSSGALRFLDQYLVMGNPSPARIVLVSDVYVNNGSGAYSNGGTNARLDKTINQLRWISRLPEFADGTVALAEPNAYFDYTIHLSGDNLHPNNEGHEVYARAVTQAARSLLR